MQKPEIEKGLKMRHDTRPRPTVIDVTSDLARIRYFMC